MEDDVRNQIENILSTSPVVNPRVPTIAVEEKEPLVNTPAMPAEQSTYQSGGSDYAIRTNVGANEPEPIDVAPYKGAGHLSNTRLANTEYGPHGALYYKTKYAPVVPFKTMYGNAEMLTSTKAKNKQSWEFDTSILGLPDLRYVGYNRIEPPTENLIQAFGRSVWNLIPWAGETIGRFGRNVIEATDSQEISAPEQLKAVMPHLFPKRPGSDVVDNISAVYRAAQEQGLINYDNKTKRFSVGDGKKNVEGQEPADVYSLNPWFASAMDDFAQWSKDNFYWTYTDENETGASDRARVAMGLGSGTGTVALSVMAPWLTGTVAATEAMDAFNDVYETNVSNGVPAKRAAVLATGAGAVVGALGALPEIGGKIAFNSLYQAERNLLKSTTNKAARMSLLNHSRPVTKNVSRVSNAVTMAGEMITEPLQTDVTNLAASNLDWSVFDTPRWDERAIEIASAFLGSVVGGAVNTRSLMNRYDDYNKRAEDFRARISDTVDTYRPILEGAVKNGILTKEQMEQLINIAYLPENFDYAMDFVQDSIAGQLDKIPGEMIEDFQKRLEAIDPNVVLEDEMKKLDQNVLEAIAKANKNGRFTSKNPFTDEDAALITALFRGIANWKIYNDGILPSQIEVPDLSPFRRQPKGGVEYGATTTVGDKVTRVTIGNNVLPVDMPSSAKPTAYDSLIPKDNPNVDRTISARHSNILHEIGGHLLEKMVGIKGSGAFFNEFYRAIEMAFGKKRAIEVKRATDKSDAKQTKKNYTSPENKSENFAQAMGALAENAARAAGIEGTPADFLTFANLMLNGMNKATVLNEAIRNYIDELEVAIKENEELVADLVNVFGTERTNNALKEYMSPDVKELSDSALPADFLAGLVEAINGFASVKSLPQLREMFAGIDPDDFVAKTQKLFKDALNAGRENVNNATPENKALYARATQAAQDNALVASVIDMLGPKAADLASDDLSESEDLEGLRGWHGTKHLFDAFKIKTGTGEGGHAHRVGIYMTTEKGRAKHYWHDIALKDNQIPIYANIEFYDYNNEGYINDKIPLMGDGPLHNAFMRWYNLHASKHSDADDILWYTKGQLLDNGEIPEQIAGSSEEVRAANNLVKYIKQSGALNAQEELQNISFSIDGDFGQLLEVLSPDTDTMLHESAKRNAQPPMVDKKLSELRPEIEKFLSQYYKGLQSRDPDLWSGEQVVDGMKSDLNYYDNGDGDDIFNVVMRAMLGRDDFKFKSETGLEAEAGKYLSDNGISGIMYFGNVDGLSAVIFDPAAAEILNKYRERETIESLEMSPFGLPTLDSFYVPETEAQASQTEAGKLLEDKVKDRTLSQDISSTLSIVKDTKQNSVTKLLNKLYKQPWVGTLADKLNSVGGERLKSLFDLVGDASKYEIKLRNLQSRFVSSIKNATGTNDVSLIALNSKLSQTVTNAKVRSIPNSDVGAFEQPIDGFVVMDLYLNKMQGDDIFERTKAGYATGEVDRILNEYLTPEIKAYGDGILNFYQSVKGDVERARGKTIGLDEEFYAPISNAFYSGLTAQGINSMMARTDRKSALVGENALELADKYIRRLASSLTGRYQTLKRLNDVIFLAPDKELTATSTPEERAEVERLKTQSSELRGAIRDVIGEDGLQNLRHDIENELSFNDVTPYVKSGALNKIGNSTVTGLLSWNPLSFFKNAANVFGFWGMADSTPQYLSDTMYALMHPKEAIEYMWQFDVIKNRFAGKGIDDLLNTDIAGGESVLTDLRNALKYNDRYNLTGTIAGITSVGNRWGLKAFMQSGDAFANIFGGYGYVKSLERRGLTKDQINNEFQKTIDETQSSSNQAMKNALQKEWQRQGLLANFISFSQEPMAKAKTITDALLAYSRGEITAKEFGKRVAPIILAVSVFAMISSGFMDLWDDDENKRNEAHKSLINEAIQALTGITPFGNTFVAPFIEYAIGTMDNPTFSPSLISETRKALNDMSQGDVDGIITRGLTFTGMLQGAPRLYNVISGGVKQFSDNESDRRVGAYQMWGRSENYAEKRAGVKK